MDHTDIVHLALYLAVRERVDGLIRDDVDPWTPVPACPGWDVHALTAHLAGLCEDWVDGRLQDYASPSWTAAHLDRFAGTPLSEALDRWAAAAASFRDLDPHPTLGDPAGFAFGDAVTHEADLRGALRRGVVPDEAVRAALKIAISRWRQTLQGAAVPTLHLLVPDERDWWLGTPDDPAAITAEVEQYELFRALAGRRAVEQVRSWRWSGDPDLFLDAGLPYPFTFADAPFEHLRPHDTR